MRTLSQLEPRTPLESLAGDSTALYVINFPGSYYISVGNVAGVTGKAAIAINASGVSIDLNGFSLIGSGAATRGIEIRGAYSNLAIRHGGIQGWTAAGIGLSTASAPSGAVIEDVQIASVVGPGIDLTGGNAISVSRCTITGAASGIIIGTNTGTVQGCAVSNLAGAGTRNVGIQAGSVTQSDVNSVSGSGGSDAYGILARVARGCSVTGIDSAGSGSSIGIQADTVTGCTATTIGSTGSGVGEGIGGNTIATCTVTVVGNSASASVQYGIVGSGSVSDCTVLNVGDSSSSALIYGIQADVASRCRVASLASKSSCTGIAARVVTGSSATNLVHLGGATGSLTGINAERVSDSQVDSISANSTAPSVGIFAKRSVGGSTASAVGNFGTGGSFGLDLGTGGAADNCHVAGSSTAGIRAVSQARVTQCEVSGPAMTTGIDCQASGSFIDGNNIAGCATAIKAVGSTLVTRNHFTTSPGKINAAATCQVGPTVNTTGVIGSTVSSANFTD